MIYLVMMIVLGLIFGFGLCLLLLFVMDRVDDIKYIRKNKQIENEQIEKMLEEKKKQFAEAKRKLKEEFKEPEEEKEE